MGSGSCFYVLKTLRMKSAAGARKNFRSFIVDRGASYHLISRRYLTAKEKKSIYALEAPIPLQTASDVVIAKEGVEVYVRELKASIPAPVLDKVPPVDSLGKLCTESGFRYIWEGPVPFWHLFPRGRH